MDTLFVRSEAENAEGKAIEPNEIIPPPSSNPLSDYFKEYLDALTAHQKQQTSSQSTVQVSEVLGAIAYLYERIRNIVEYKGEHVVRRNAIERILKRLLWERIGAQPERIATILVRELIWARYLPNDAVPKNKVTTVSHVISKYLFLLGKLQERGTSVPFGTIRTWVLGIASCEIEETFDPINREPYVVLMYQWFKTYFKWESATISEHERDIQTYITIHRALTKSDDQIIDYHLLIKEFPSWKSATPETINALVDRFSAVYTEIERHIQFSYKNALYRRIQRQVAPFEMLREVMRIAGTKFPLVLANPDELELKVREVCQIRYAQIRQKVNRGILRSIIYIFVTKIVLALIIEVPYELYRFGHLTYIPIAINVLLPPVLMYLLGLTISTPGDENTSRIITKIRSIVYAHDQVVPTVFTLSIAKRNSALSTVFTLVYGALFFLIFGGISYLLLLIHFNIVGIAIFFAFLSLVLLFGYRVRYTATEITVTSEKENIFQHLFSNLTLPFLNMGVYLSKGLAKINIFTVILDFLIEAPLKTVIEVFEEWTSYIREKKEEVVEVPGQ